MTKQLTNLILACSATCLMGVALQAQTYHSRAVVPFAFQVDSKTMDAGDYAVLRSASQLQSLRNNKTGRSVFIDTHAGVAESKGPARLVFHRYEGKYFLAEVWSPDQRGTILKPGNAEREMIRSGSRLEASVVVLTTRTVAD